MLTGYSGKPGHMTATLRFCAWMSRVWSLKQTAHMNWSPGNSFHLRGL